MLVVLSMGGNSEIKTIDDHMAAVYDKDTSARAAWKQVGVYQ